SAAEEIELTPTQRADLERRLAEYEDDPSGGSSWEDVKARIRAR
ncbi:MAG TPA: addiction module protein, partial [Planctomycetes bacterium]|nr:addiction module protein [Planctomycetota bacterium]